ncbi:MAG: amino acid-binding protein [Bacteroidales bacterium]|nr:amino acid-binding protein [Bacteroidales bacterium]
MRIKQLSIFIENQSGTLIRVLELLGKAHIQMIACTIADTAEYGIFRIICSEPDRACSELKAAGVAVTISEVFAIEMNDRPGGAAEAVKAFSNAGIEITYMYAFLLNGKGIMIIRTDETEKAREVIKSQGLPYLCEKDFIR